MDCRNTRPLPCCRPDDRAVFMRVVVRAPSRSRPAGSLPVFAAASIGVSAGARIASHFTRHGYRRAQQATGGTATGLMSLTGDVTSVGSALPFTQFCCRTMRCARPSGAGLLYLLGCFIVTYVGDNGRGRGRRPGCRVDPTRGCSASMTLIVRLLFWLYSLHRHPRRDPGDVPELSLRRYRSRWFFFLQGSAGSVSSADGSSPSICRSVTYLVMTARGDVAGCRRRRRCGRPGLAARNRSVGTAAPTVGSIACTSRWRCATADGQHLQNRVLSLFSAAPASPYWNRCTYSRGPPIRFDRVAGPNQPVHVLVRCRCRRRVCSSR